MTLNVHLTTSFFVLMGIHVAYENYWNNIFFFIPVPYSCMKQDYILMPMPYYFLNSMCCIQLFKNDKFKFNWVTDNFFINWLLVLIVLGYQTWNKHIYWICSFIQICHQIYIYHIGQFINLIYKCAIIVCSVCIRKFLKFTNIM